MLLIIREINPGKINILSILCAFVNQVGVGVDLLIIIIRGNTIPDIAHIAKSFPKMKDEKRIQSIRNHNMQITSCLVRLMPNTTGKVRSPAFLSPIRSSPSFNISLGRLIKKTKKAGKAEFFKVRKAAEAMAPTINVIERSADIVIFPIKGLFFKNGEYITSKNVAANPIFNKSQSINKNIILPDAKRATEINRACFFVSLPEGINLSGLFISSDETSK